MTLNGLLTAFKHENVWFEASKYSEAERDYQVYLSRKSADSVKATGRTVPAENTSTSSQDKPISSMSLEIAKARETIKNLFPVSIESCSSRMVERIQSLEENNKMVNEKLESMSVQMKAYEELLNDVTASLKRLQCGPNESTKQEKADKNGVADSDDDIDLFGSDEETAEDARIKEERVKAYADKKAKKPALVAKSSVVLDVKPWDDETNMKSLENAVRQICTDGLLWGASKLVPLAYGIKKLQIVAIVEDDKVSIDWLQEAIQENEDLVQSVDVAAFNKL